MIGYHHEKNDDDFYVLKMGRDGTRPPTRWLASTAGRVTHQLFGCQHFCQPSLDGNGDYDDDDGFDVSEDNCVDDEDGWYKWLFLAAIKEHYKVPYTEFVMGNVLSTLH